jgi:hypothetical protein
VAFLETINKIVIFTVALQIRPLLILDPRAEGYNFRTYTEVVEGLFSTY